MTPTLLAALRAELGSHFSAERAGRVRRLVLEDAREPTQALAEVGADAGGEIYSSQASRAFTAMIDALLSE